MGRKNKVLKSIKSTILLICDDTKGGLEYIKNYISNKYTNDKYAINMGDTITPSINKPELNSKSTYSIIKTRWNACQKDYDFFFIIADGDNLTGNRKQTIDNLTAFAQNSKNKSKIKFILNTPCIEVWYLCHFTLPSTYFSVNQLKKHITKYSKDINPYSRIVSSQKVAHTNALQLRRGKKNSSAVVWTDMDLL